MEMELYYKKLEILTCHINKYITGLSVENKELLDTTPEKDKSHIKTFLAKTVKNKENFRKQSTKIFLDDYYLFEGIKRIWGALGVDDKVMIWKLLFEMFILSVQVFPIVKQTDYTYVSIYLLLEETKTDISLPKLSALTIVSVLSKASMEHINKEFEEGKISKHMVEMLFEEFKMDSVSSLQEAQSKAKEIKQKFKDLMEKKEIKDILTILKRYFTEYVIERVGNDFKDVFESRKFKKFSQQYDKNYLMGMLQRGELNFVTIRQMIIDSGITDLFGEDFEFPTCFEEFVVMIKKYTGKDIKEKDLKEFFEENLKSISDTPYFKKFIKNSGYKDMLDPILNLFKKTDHKEETLKRKMKRRKKKLRKLKKEALNEEKKEK